MFIRISGARFRVLKQGTGGAWVIAYDEYQMPRYVSRDELDRAERIAAPEEYVRNRERPHVCGPAAAIRPAPTSPGG